MPAQDSDHSRFTYRLGYTEDVFQLPHSSPTTPDHHAVNFRAIEEAINNIPVSSTQTINWDLTLDGDGTSVIVGQFTLLPGTYKIQILGQLTSSSSNLTDGGADATITPDASLQPVAGAIDPSITPGSPSSFLTGSGLFRVIVPTTMTWNVFATCATPSDTVATTGAIILDPATTR